MGNSKIPKEIKEIVDKIIDDFNAASFKKESGIKYYLISKGEFLYLNRKEKEQDGPISRLKFNGKIDNWGFAIFKWSSEKYDPDEFFFPGSQHLNGTIEGALKASNEAYPPSWTPSKKEINQIFNLFLKKK